MKEDKGRFDVRIGRNWECRRQCFLPVHIIVPKILPRLFFILVSSVPSVSSVVHSYFMKCFLESSLGEIINASA